MMIRNHTILPIKFNYNGVGVETKVLKYAYNREVMYKVALPSAQTEKDTGEPTKTVPGFAGA